MAEALVTGYPGFVTRMMYRRLIQDGDNVRLLVRPRYAAEARQLVERLGGPGHGQVLIGDVVQVDLGLSGSEVRRLLREVDQIYHLAAIRPRSPRVELMHRVNVEGTRSILELAMSADHLQRFVFFSTAFVSGDRTGVVLEDELDRGQRFQNPFQQTKFEAEKLVHRAQTDLPVTVLRPSLIVGHSRTGEIDPIDDPYDWIRAFLTASSALHLPLPGYVCSAALHIARDPRGVGGTFHLTDPNPLPARRVLELLAIHGQAKAPKGSIPAAVLKQLMRVPGLERFGPPRHFIDHVAQLTIYNTTHTLELLGGTEIRCPPFETYVGTLVASLRASGLRTGGSEA